MSVTRKTLAFFILFFLLGSLSVIIFWHYKTAPLLQPSISQTFSFANPPIESLTARIATVSGDVLWEARIATQPGRLTVHALQQGEEIDTGKTGHLTFIFPDKGSVILSPNTTVSLVQTLPHHIVLSQQDGSVIYSPTTTFAIRAGDLLVNITSGQLKVTMDTTNNLSIVTLIKGTATASYTDSENSTQVISLEKGQTVRFNSSTLTAVLQ